jgi:hypothetical protein
MVTSDTLHQNTLDDDGGSVLYKGYTPFARVARELLSAAHCATGAAEASAPSPSALRTHRAYLSAVFDLSNIRADLPTSAPAASRRDSAAWVCQELAAGDHYRAQGLSCEDCGSSSHAEAGP